MIKLTRILKEIIQESNIIKIPQTELDKADRVYNFIVKNFGQLKLKTTNRTEDNPLILPNLKDYFKLTGYKNNQILVSIGFYQDKNTKALGRIDINDRILLINISEAPQHNVDDFKDTVEHELVHIVDPKTSNPELFNREYAKKGAEPKGDENWEKDVAKYLKSPWEFDAFTSPLINKIKRNIDKSDNPPHLKDLLNQFMYDLKTHDSDELVGMDKYNIIPWLFTTEPWDSENINKVAQDYADETNKIKVWITKPTLYTRFLKRLFRNI